MKKKILIRSLLTGVLALGLCYDWYFLIWSSNIVVCFYKLNACLDVVLVVDTQYQAGLVEVIGIPIN